MFAPKGGAGSDRGPCGQRKRGRPRDPESRPGLLPRSGPSTFWSKTNTLDAEAAARAMLSGQAVAVPEFADGTVEMIRQIKIARDTARKGRTAAIVTLKALIVTTPAELREQLDVLTDKILINRCANLSPGAGASTTASAKHSRAWSRTKPCPWLTPCGCAQAANFSQ